MVGLTHVTGSYPSRVFEYSNLQSQPGLHLLTVVPLTELPFPFTGKKSTTLSSITTLQLSSSQRKPCRRYPVFASCTHPHPEPTTTVSEDRTIPRPIISLTMPALGTMSGAGNQRATTGVKPYTLIQSLKHLHAHFSIILHQATKLWRHSGPTTRRTPPPTPARTWLSSVRVHRAPDFGSSVVQRLHRLSRCRYSRQMWLLVMVTVLGSKTMVIINSAI